MFKGLFVTYINTYIRGNSFVSKYINANVGANKNMYGILLSFTLLSVLIAVSVGLFKEISVIIAVFMMIIISLIFWLWHKKVISKYIWHFTRTICFYFNLLSDQSDSNAC